MAQGRTDFDEGRGDDLGGFLRQQRRLSALSLRRLSELSGVSNPYLSQIERGLRRPSADVLAQLAKALELSTDVLYVRAGFLPPGTTSSETAVPDVIGAIRSDATLDEAQKRTLIHIYRSFRGLPARETAMADQTPVPHETVPPGERRAAR